MPTTSRMCCSGERPSPPPRNWASDWAAVENELGSAVERFVNERADVVVVLGDAALLTVRRQIAAFALASRLPTVFSFREHVEDGGLVSYGVNLRENYRRAAYFADRILKGEKPADLP